MKKLLYVALLALGVVVLMAPPVMAQEEKPFTIHGEVRFRGEYQNNTIDFDDNGSPEDQALFWPYRYRIAAEGRFTKNVSAWIEFQNADIAGNNSGASNGVIGGPFRTGQGGDGSDVELYQANMTIGGLWSKNFSLRIGRQEMVAGNELLLGDLDFYAGISHDGGVGNWVIKKTNLMLWYTRPNEGSVASGFGNVNPVFSGITIAAGPTTTIHFFGAYATWTIMKDQNLDIYGMGLNDRGNSANFQTVGARWARDNTSKGGFIWNLEYAQQFGDASAAANAKGHVLEGWFGFNMKAGKNLHRFYARVENASGDDASSTGDFEGFIPLFGDYHNRAGRGDWFVLSDASYGGLVGPGGLMALGAGWTGYFGDRTEFGAQAWKYELDDDNGGDKDLGRAIDVWYGYNYSRNLNFVVSLSQLKPGDALTGGSGFPDDDVTRLYGQARLRF